MLKDGLRRVTANHGNLTHLIFVRPRSVVIDDEQPFRKHCAASSAGDLANPRIRMRSIRGRIGCIQAMVELKMPRVVAPMFGGMQRR